MNRREKEQVEIEKERYASKRVKIAVDKLYLIMMSVLHDEFGFGQQRLMKLLNAMTLESEVQASAMIDDKNYKASVEEKTGVVLKEYFMEELHEEL